MMKLIVTFVTNQSIVSISSPQELLREVKETGWDGGGQNPAKLSRAEVQVATKRWLLIFCLDLNCLNFSLEKWIFFQIILDAKDSEEAEADNNTSSVADCLEHIEARIKQIKFHF